MAIGVLLSMEEISVGSSETTAFLGAMSLDGGVRAVEGMLPAVLAAKKLGISKVSMPFDPDLPALELEGLEIIYISTLEEVLQHLPGQNILPPLTKEAQLEVMSLYQISTSMTEYS
jgi:magnesium chelatase family protein